MNIKRSDVTKMVDIVCRPPKQLIILECTKYPSVDSLSKTAAVIMSTGESLVLKWAEGVVFTYSQVAPSTELLIDEYVKGNVYWSDVVFAIMPEYKQTIRVGAFDVPIIDVSPNPLIREAARWMKNQTSPF